MRKLFLLCAAFLLTACSPQTLPVKERVSVPDLAHDVFYASDGEKLALKQWRAKSPEAVIVAVHGYNDYSNAFELFGQAMQERNISVLAYDQRGFGRNEGLGIWPGSENLVADAADMVKATRAQHPSVPLYLLGSSMGSSVLVEMLHQHPNKHVHGVILSAPAIWGGESANSFRDSISKAILWSLAHCVPDATFTGEELKIQATDNMEILKEMSQDPYMIKRSRIDSVYQLVGLMGDSYDHQSVLQSYPTLLLYGKKDEVVPPLPIYHVAKNLPENNVRIYEEGYHLLLRDLQRDKVFDDISNWVLKVENE